MVPDTRWGYLLGGDVDIHRMNAAASRAFDRPLEQSLQSRGG